MGKNTFSFEIKHNIIYIMQVKNITVNISKVRITDD